MQAVPFLAFLLLLLLKLPLSAAEQPVVGELGRLESLIFTGTAHFSAAAIREQLSWDMPYYLASRPSSPLGQLTPLVAQRISSCYVGGGFLDVAVKSAVDGAHIRTDIIEGQQYLAGPVIIDGLEPDEAAAVVALATGAQNAMVPSAARDSYSAYTGVEKSWWSPGKPACFQDPEGMRKFVVSILANMGYLSAEVGISCQRREHHFADLILSIAHGPHAILGEVVIAGLAGTARAALEQFLDLKRGESFSQLQATRIEERIRASGRFAREHVEVVPITGSPACRLTITVAESVNIPHLPKHLPEEQEVVFGLVKSFTDMLRNGPEDLVLEMTAASPPHHPSIRMVFSPRRGLAMRYHLAQQDGLSTVTIAGADHRLFFWDNRGHGAVIMDGGDPWVLVEMKGRELDLGEVRPAGRGDPTTLTYQFGWFDSLNAHGIQAKTLLEPASILSLWIQSLLENNKVGDAWLFTFTAGVHAQIDRVTSRFKVLEWESHGLVAGLNLSFRLHAEVGAFERMMAEREAIAVAASPPQTSWNANEVLTELADIAAMHIAMTDDAKMTRMLTIVAALRKTMPADIIDFASSKIIGHREAIGDFPAPANLEDVVRNQLATLGQAAALFIRFAHSLSQDLGATSWPAELVRGIIGFLMSDRDAILVELAHLEKGGHMGPLGCIATSWVSARFPDLSTYFAQLGVASLDQQGFERDVTLLHPYAHAIVEGLLAMDDDIGMMLPSTCHQAALKAQDDLKRAIMKVGGTSDAAALDAWCKALWIGGGREACAEELKLRSISTAPTPP